MSELRWILLGAGVALIMGLWWWESRKARARTDSSEPLRPRARAEPSVESSADSYAAASAAPVTSYSPTIDRQRTPRRPPLIEIPEDAEVDVSAYVGKDRRQGREPAYMPPAAAPEPAIVAIEPEPDVVAEDDAAGFEEQQDDHHRAPWIRTHPLEREDFTPEQEPEPAPPEDPFEQHTAESSKLRIVALRLIAQDGRWSGQALRVAIQSEGMRFGKYSIFHREREDGKTLFYIASMMEPGSFDFARMDEQTFPGISIFGLVPGPIDAPEAFDMVLATGRRLAEKLKGQLQDEQGSTLTAQRILNLREELVQFEHRRKRLRRS